MVFFCAECKSRKAHPAYTVAFQRLEDDLFQGRGWLLHLGDRITALEIRLSASEKPTCALAGILQDTLSETVSRKNACGFDVSFPGTTDIQQRWKLVLVGNRTTLSLILRSLHRLLLWHRSSLAFQMMNSSHAASFEEDGECNPLSPGYSSLGSWW